MANQLIEKARERYGIDAWGAGFFSIDHAGHVVCTPKGPEFASISLQNVIEAAKQQGVSTPMIVRFPQIIKEQLRKMSTSFKDSIMEFGYHGSHLGVFPFKVNQRREFIDAIVSCGKEMHWGLEVGSKTEFVAALSYPLSDKSLLICNGFKDHEFINISFIAAAMGRNVLLVIEGPDELQTMIKKIKEAKGTQKLPTIGIRVRLYSKGSGKWAKSSGETSKFGLTIVEVMHALDLIEKAGLQHHLTMLHFHIGSQITAIKRFKNALREAARVYAKIVKLGFNPKYLNIGGGVGVDYDGSKTSGPSSANYNLQEFANDAVYVVGEVCNQEGVAHPDIVTESGRVIAAYHSVVVTDIREVQDEEESRADLEKMGVFESADVNKVVRELQYTLRNINSKNFNEYYHDAIEYHEDLFSLFDLGYVSLKERAAADSLFHQICLKTLKYASGKKKAPEEFDSLQKLKVSKYLANFSIFQSIPDSWSIDQLFPVVPISRHDEKPSKKGTIVDITCDSDGCLERFVDTTIEKSVLELHKPNGKPYYLGFFLVGAYQESLANEHNLFGAIHEVEVCLEQNGTWNISKITKGDPIMELLVCRNYEEAELVGSYKAQLAIAVEKGILTQEKADKIFVDLSGFLNAYPYLQEKSSNKSC